MSAAARRRSRSSAVIHWSPSFTIPWSWPVLPDREILLRLGSDRWIAGFRDEILVSIDDVLNVHRMAGDAAERFQPVVRSGNGTRGAAGLDRSHLVRVTVTTVPSLCVTVQPSLVF